MALTPQPQTSHINGITKLILWLVRVPAPKQAPDFLADFGGFSFLELGVFAAEPSDSADPAP